MRMKGKHLEAEGKVERTLSALNQATAESNAYKDAWLLVESSVAQEANEKHS